MRETKTNDTMQKTNDTALARSERVHAAHACGSHTADRTRKHAARELEVDPRHRHSTAAQPTATVHAKPCAGGMAAGAIIMSAAAAEACLAYRAFLRRCAISDRRGLSVEWCPRCAPGTRGCRGNERAVWKHFSRAGASYHAHLFGCHGEYGADHYVSAKRPLFTPQSEHIHTQNRALSQDFLTASAQTPRGP